MKKNAVFVTATGTDIGKTFVSALIVKKMREWGYNCGYYKPALSGAVKQLDGSLLAGDCDYVVRTSGLTVASGDCVTYCFEEAVSPHLAAARKGINISSEVIASEFVKKSAKFDFMVVEGAGGITCPFSITDDKVLLLPEVIKALGLDILVVADGGLGTINSVLLTVEYAKSQNLNIKGIILNNFNESDFMHKDNMLQVERLTGIKVLATVKKGDLDLAISEPELISCFN